jgi:hypothetical protein
MQGLDLAWKTVKSFFACAARLYELEQEAPEGLSALGFVRNDPSRFKPVFAMR